MARRCCRILTGLGNSAYVALSNGVLTTIIFASLEQMPSRTALTHGLQPSRDTTFAGGFIASP
jgi:hypothetical protein